MTFAYIETTVPPGETLARYSKRHRRLSRWRLWWVRLGGVA